MKLILASSLCVVLTASAWGQHVGSAGHAGFARSGGGISSGRSFAPPPSNAQRSFGSAPAYRPSLPTQQRSYQFSSPSGPAPFGGTYPYGERARGGQRGDHHGDGHRPNYSRGVYAVPGFLNYGYGVGYGGYGFGYSDSLSDQQPQEATGPDPNAMLERYSDGGDAQSYAQPARPAYQAEAATAPPLRELPEVTLMFKDGRAPVQIQNYAVTRKTLYVLDGARRREIPLDQLDVALTEKTNREAGIDFSIPAVAD